MNTLSRIYGLPNTNLHVFYDLESHLIGFNRNGSIFFNLRYWEAWHDDDASKRNVAPALISWFVLFSRGIEADESQGTSLWHMKLRTTWCSPTTRSMSSTFLQSVKSLSCSWSRCFSNDRIVVPNIVPNVVIGSPDTEGVIIRTVCTQLLATSSTPTQHTQI